MLRPIAAALVLLAAAVPPPADGGDDDRISLWVAGEGGYASYRIPALERTPGGVLLAFCEGRKGSASDHGDIDLMLRRSLDDGRTWTPSEVLHEEGGDAPITIGNPCPIADSDAGLTHLLFCQNNERIFYTATADDGETWEEPREITAALDGFDYDVVRVATGPGHGIRLTAASPAPGRLVVPVWLNRYPLRQGPDSKDRYVSACLISDDGGKNWRASGLVPPTLHRCNEACVSELPDGRLLMNVRLYGVGFRALSLSDDGGETWSAPSLVTQLPDVTCQGSMRHVGDGRLLQTNVRPPQTPDKPSRKRQNLTLSESRDAGRTWAAVEVIEPGPSGYSDLVLAEPTEDGAEALLCLFECGEKSYRERIDLARLPLRDAPAADGPPEEQPESAANDR